MTSYPLNDALSELEFEDLDPWEDTRGVGPLPHGVDQHSVEGNPTNIAMWIESAKESTIWMSFVSTELMQNLDQKMHTLTAMGPLHFIKFTIIYCAAKAGDF